MAKMGKEGFSRIQAKDLRSREKIIDNKKFENIKYTNKINQIACLLMLCYDTDRETKARRLPFFYGGIKHPPNERKEGDAMVTYSDMIQFCIFIVALVGLCYEIFKGKRRQPPLPQIVTAIVQQLNIITKVAACGFPLCILNIAYPVVGRKSIKKITDVPNEKFSNEKICKKETSACIFRKAII